MKKTILFFTTIILFGLLSSCSSIIENFPPFNETLTLQSTNTFTPDPQPPQENTPTNTQILPTATATFTPLPEATDTPMTPTEDVIATLAALQATLVAQSDHIATLEAQKTSSAGSGSGSGSSGSKTSTPSSSIPSNVRKVTIINKANLRISKKNNAVGKPIMSIPKPRITLDEGSIQYIYNKRVDSDGSVVYYEIWDPDGVVTQVLYIRAVDIQIRNSNYNTKYGTIPDGVVMAIADPQAVLRYIKEYNVGGRPLMKIKEPRVVLVKDTQTWIYPDPVLSDGGNLFYEIYDPDGNVQTVLYARIADLWIPNALQQ